jgi:hypothetical protein
MVFGFRSFRITLGVCGFLTFGLISWVAMANNQPYYGYINNDITIIAVPAGLGLLGAIIYALFWNISIYLVGGKSLIENDTRLETFNTHIFWLNSSWWVCIGHVYFML